MSSAVRRQEQDVTYSRFDGVFLMARLKGSDAFPFSSITAGSPNSNSKNWLQNGRDTGYGPSARFCAPERRINIDFNRGKGFDPLCHATLDLMERDLGGHCDRHDPMGFLWIITDTEERASYIFGGNVCVNGTAWSGDTEGICLQFDMPYYQSIGLCVFGRTLKLPIRTSQKFNWDVLDDEGFERLMFRLYFEMDFDNVQWLQKTRAPDSGRDISAERIENGNRVLIQARHQSASINAPDVNDVVVKAETWHPAFDEVIIVTTSAFTQEAVRWVDSHNANPGNRPIVTLEPNGHLEVMLSKHPELIAHLGLRN